MKIQKPRIVMVSLLVLTLFLIFSAHVALTSAAETDPSLEKRDVSGDATELEEKPEGADASMSRAVRATGNSKMYVVNDSASMGATAIRGEATATGEPLDNYGGYFTAASDSGRGVYGEATGTGLITNYGGYFVAGGDDGRGVYGYSNGHSGRGVHGETFGIVGAGVVGIASNTGLGQNTGGSFSAWGSSGRGVHSITYGTNGRGVVGIANSAGATTNYGGYFYAKGTEGQGVYGEATNSGTVINYGGYFAAAGTYGRGVYGEATDTGTGTKHGGLFVASGTNGRGVYGKATGASGQGVRGDGGEWDFYAAGSGGDYGPFTGAHEVKFAEDMPGEIVPGMIISVTGKTETRKNERGKISLSSTLPTVTISTQARDKAVFGVIVSDGPLSKDHWYEAEEDERFGVVNALGEGRVWVTDINGEIQAGDYITTSSVPGYGQMQDDDLLHSYTLGKAIETVDFDQVNAIIRHNGNTYKVYLLAVVYTSG